MSSTEPAASSASIAKETPTVNEKIARLTRRQRQIFELVVEGRSNRAIAELLGLSVKTVQTHRAKVNRRLEVHSAGALLALAYRAKGEADAHRR